MEGLGGPVNLDRYSTSGIDPALEDCCRREVVSNRKHNALTATLRRHDVAALAERRRRHLVSVPGSGDSHACRCSCDPASDGGEYQALIEYRERKEVEPEEEPSEDEEEKSEVDSDDEFDYLLDEDFGTQDDSLRQLEDERRAELEYQLLMREMAQHHGYGVHRQLHPNRILKVAGLGRNAQESARQGLPPPPQAVVIHLLEPESLASASLDYFFETQLARDYGGTIFVRSTGRSVLSFDADLARKSFPASILDRSNLPALVAVRGGIVVATCPKLMEFTFEEGGEIEPHAVKQWLERVGILVKEPPMDDVCLIRPEEEAHMDFMLSKMQPQAVPSEEDFYQCGVKGCQKKFHHQHVGIQNTEQDGLVVNEETVLGDNMYCQFLE